MRNFIEIECCNCGVIFMVSEGLNDNWKKTKATFHCPNGHGQSYTKSTEENLREMLEFKRKRITDQDIEIARLERKLNLKLKKNGKSK